MRVNVTFRMFAGPLLCLTTAFACSQSPIAPSTPAQPSAGEAVAAPDASVIHQAAGLSLEEIAARGWDCRPAPMIPNRAVCSPPNQLHPLLLPGAIDGRPETFTLLVFDNGVFFGTDLLIRSDLYHGQQCKSTEAPYRFISRIGYYECVHLTNAR